VLGYVTTEVTGHDLPSPGSSKPADLATLSGLHVEDNDDDDPVLVYPDGRTVDTWREDYPYRERMRRHEYENCSSCKSGCGRPATGW
jgi:hypothetical protein